MSTRSTQYFVRDRPERGCRGQEMGWSYDAGRNLNRFGSLESLRDVVPKLILGTRRHRPRKSCVLRTPLYWEPLLRTPFPPLRWRNDELPCEGTRERRRRGSVAGSHPGATSEGKNTYVEVCCSRGWRRSSAVDADGGKVGKKCGESGLDRYPGVGHLLDPRRCPPPPFPPASAATHRAAVETTLPSWKSGVPLPDLAFSAENILSLCGGRGHSHSCIHPWALAEFWSCWDNEPWEISTGQRIVNFGATLAWTLKF